MICPNCKNEINNGAKFCPKCGAVQNSSQLSETANIKPKNKKLNIKISVIILLVVILFAGLFLGGFLYYLKYKDIVMTVDGYDVSTGVYNCFYTQWYDNYTSLKESGYYDEMTQEEINSEVYNFVKESVALYYLAVENQVGLSEIQQNYIDENVTSDETGSFHSYTENDCREKLEIYLLGSVYENDILEAQITDDEISLMAEEKETSKNYYTVDYYCVNLGNIEEDEANSILNGINSLDDLIEVQVQILLDSEEYSNYNYDDLKDIFSSESSATIKSFYDSEKTEIATWITYADIYDVYLLETEDQYFIYMKCSNLYREDEECQLIYEYTYSDVDDIDFDLNIQTSSSAVDFFILNGNWSNEITDDIFVEDLRKEIATELNSYGDNKVFEYDNSYSSVFFIRTLEHQYYEYAYEDVYDEKYDEIISNVEVKERLAYKTVT